MRLEETESEKADENPVLLLASREESSMVSTWTNHLGLERLAEGRWRVGTYGYELIGSFYDLVPEEQWYTEDGELAIPDFWEGHRIIGLADGEYLETDELVTADYADFMADQLEIASEFCESRGWADRENFESAWAKLLSSVKAAG